MHDIFTPRTIAAAERRGPRRYPLGTNARTERGNAEEPPGVLMVSLVLRFRTKKKYLRSGRPRPHLRHAEIRVLARKEGV